MTSSIFNPRDRRALALGALVLLPVLVYALVGRPYARALVEARAELAAERDLLTRELALLSLADTLPALGRMATVRVERINARLFEDAGDLSALAFERYLLDLAEESRVRVEQSHATVDETAPGELASIEATLRGVSDLEGVLDLLYTLENGTKLVRVERIALEPISTGASGSEKHIAVWITATGFGLPVPEVPE